MEKTGDSIDDADYNEARMLVFDRTVELLFSKEPKRSDNGFDGCMLSDTNDLLKLRVSKTRVLRTLANKIQNAASSVFAFLKKELT